MKLVNVFQRQCAYIFHNVDKKENREASSDVLSSLICNYVSLQFISYHVILHVWPSTLRWLSETSDSTSLEVMEGLQLHMRPSTNVVQIKNSD